MVAAALNEIDQMVVVSRSRNYIVARERACDMRHIYIYMRQRNFVRIVSYTISNDLRGSRARSAAYCRTFSAAHERAVSRECSTAVGRKPARTARGHVWKLRAQMGRRGHAS